MNIENNVAPPVENKVGRPAKYPFKEMKHGESVFFEGEKTGGKIYTAAKAYGRYNNKKFTARAVDGGLRIWCIE